MVSPFRLLRTSKNILILSLICSLACILAFSLYVEPGLNPPSGRSHVIGLQLAFQKSEGLKFLEAWGDTGKKHFLDTLWIDFVFPAGYSLLLASLLARSIYSLHLPEWMRIIVILPFAAALLDFIENILEFMFVSKPDSFSEYMFFMHSIIASLKWTLALFTISFLTVSSLYYRFKSSQKNP